MKSFSLGKFFRISLFLIGILFLVIIFSLISYYSIDKVQKKNNLMDIEEYSPISSLVVESNPLKKSKFPFIDVHSHHWDMPLKDLSDLASEMDSLNMAYLINLSGSGFAVFSGNKSLMDLNLKKSIENVNSNFPKRFGVFVNIDLSRIDHPEFKSTTLKTPGTPPKSIPHPF